MLYTIEQKSIIFWQNQEQAIVLTRWNGNIELTQGANSILIGDESDPDELIKAIRDCKNMSWEKV